MKQILTQEQLDQMKKEKPNIIYSKIVWKCENCCQTFKREESLTKHRSRCQKTNSTHISDIRQGRLPNPDLEVNGIRTYKEAWKIVVSLSRPSKMPCFAYSLSAKRCITGSQLAKIKGTICNSCYALSNTSWYTRSHVTKILEKRADAIHNPMWHWAMIYLIYYFEMRFFRWHDSGDIQSIVHLAKIAFIAKMCPFCKFWLPTREWGIVNKFWEMNGQKPLSELYPNLIIRLSSTEFDGKAPIKLARKLGVQASAVSAIKFDCPASKQGHKCLDCRNCWNNKIECVTYAMQQTKGLIKGNLPSFPDLVKREELQILQHKLHVLQSD
jgi:hypothetical protein